MIQNEADRIFSVLYQLNSYVTPGEGIKCLMETQLLLLWKPIAATSYIVITRSVSLNTDLIASVEDCNLLLNFLRQTLAYSNSSPLN